MSGRPERRSSPVPSSCSPSKEGLIDELIRRFLDESLSFKAAPPNTVLFRYVDASFMQTMGLARDRSITTHTDDVEHRTRLRLFLGAVAPSGRYAPATRKD